MLTVLSLGAGVQSSTLALMAAAGEIQPMPDCAIFADTQAEPRAVYEWLDWLVTQLPFPVHRVTAGSLTDNILDPDTEKFISIPAFGVLDGRNTMLRRQCTREFKLAPMHAKVRQLLGLAKGQHGPREVAVEVWIGISLDEMQRMKESEHRWVRNRWPLIELRMERRHCQEWLWRRFRRRAPRSACGYCPFHSDAKWRQQRDHDPETWALTRRVDAAIRDKRQYGLDSTLYLHDARRPIEEVDLTTAADEGQLDLVGGFQNECEGMCGV
ncbi:MAG: hypothetical protein OSA97_00510 [Nevskia sp.]|nr:hypothetical protein [Nevskia sp.]